MEQLLGPLEQKVMTVLWHLGRGTVRDVLEHLPSAPKPAYTTVMTIMVRLEKKGILERSPRGNSYIYEPTLSPDGLVEESSRKAVQDVLQRFGDLAVAHFLQEAQLSAEQLQQLQQLAEGEEDSNDCEPFVLVVGMARNRRADHAGGCQRTPDLGRRAG